MTKKQNKFFSYFLVGLTVVAGLVWFSVFDLEAQGGPLRVHFFDIGQGDAIFIEAPDGNQVLIDGGPDEAVLAKLGDAMPFWDRSIDLLILTHPHADHLDGLIAVLKRYHVEAVLESGVNHSIPEYQEWRRLLRDKGIKVITAKAGERLWLGENTYLDVLAPLDDFFGKSPKDIHDATVIAKLTHGQTSILFTGDAEKSLEHRLLYELDVPALSGRRSTEQASLLAGGSPNFVGRLDSDVLKVGHHGSKTSSAENFLNAVSPEIAVISAGRKNRYGHPHQDVLDRLRAHGARIFRTDLDGDILMASDGREIKFK